MEVVAVLAEALAVVGEEHDHGVLVLTGPLEGLEQLAEPHVRERDLVVVLLLEAGETGRGDRELWVHHVAAMCGST